MISLRAYAEHRAVSVMAVSRAVKSGRLSTSVTRDGRGQPKIADVALADVEWARNTDLSRAPGYVKERAEATVQTSAQPALPPSGESGATDPAPADATRQPTLTEASAAEKHWKAKIAQMQYEERIGLLVKARDVQERTVKDYTEVRTKLLMIPSKAKFAIPTLTHADTAKLDQLIREALEALAGPDARGPELPADDAEDDHGERVAV